ncbi:MAG TPA: hypothetical protein VFB93_21605 [Burkholderiales bacterium]|nr:hypothetical protein [Burkholderiales bacterium]
MRLALAATIIPIVLVACAPAPVTKAETEGLNYGPRPVRWKEEITSYLSVRLTDPKAAIVEFRTEPQQMFQRAVALRPMHYGWATCVWVNDKNRSGAYAGFYPMTVFIRNEKIVQVNGGPDDFGVGAQYARSQCESLGAPFKQS